MSLCLRWLISGVLATLLGCAGTGGRSPARSEAPEDAIALSLLARGETSEALRRYQALAALEPRVGHWRVCSAETALKLGHTEEALSALRGLDPSRLTGLDQDRVRLIEARLDLAQGEAQKALNRLDSVANSSNLPEAELKNFLVLSVSALTQLGRSREAARQRVALDRLLTVPKERIRNQTTLLDLLTPLKAAELGPEPGSAEDFNGWLDLARTLKTTAQGSAQAAVAEWRAAHPRHPAEAALLESLKGLAPLNPKGAAETVGEGPFIGVLLPLSGPHAKAGQAVRSGLEAAYRADSKSEKLRLRFLDTASGSLDLRLSDAEAQGAIGFIGPLDKESLGHLIALPDRRQNVLALNEVPGAVPPGLVAFSLSPEAELDQLAAEIRLRGARSAALILPDTPFGQRLGQHFDGSFRRQGGIALGQVAFTPRDPGRASLASLLPVLPEDAVVVLIADAEDARAIVPNLTASVAVPLYAAPKVYEGLPDVPANAALHGLHFCDMPFLLDPNPIDPEEGDSPEARRLFALGLDAYQLFPKLWGHPVEDPLLDGATGRLRLGPDHRIQRQLSCAHFVKTRPIEEGLAPLETGPLSSQSPTP